MQEDNIPESSLDKHQISIDNNPDKKINLSKLKSTFKRNPWVIATILLAIFGLVFLILMLRGGITGNIITGKVVGEADAGELFLNFANSMGANAELVEVNSKSGLYEVVLSISGQEAPFYVTRDGKYYIPPTGFIPITSKDNKDSQAEVPKSDKPKVELFVWAYCPYGVQAQGPLAEVVSLLEEYATFETVLYYDGHGAFETQQNKIQACIQEISKDKYWEYAAGFVKNIYPKCSTQKTVECDKTESVKLMKSLGIDDSKIMSCVNAQGKDLISEYSARAEKSGIQGSPSLLINGVKVDAARNPEAFKTAVCDAFNTAPKECSQVLKSSTNTTSGGSCG